MGNPTEHYRENVCPSFGFHMTFRLHGNVPVTQATAVALCLYHSANGTGVINGIGVYVTLQWNA